MIHVQPASSPLSACQPSCAAEKSPGCLSFNSITSSFILDKIIPNLGWMGGRFKNIREEFLVPQFWWQLGKERQKYGLNVQHLKCAFFPLAIRGWLYWLQGEDMTRRDEHAFELTVKENDTDWLCEALHLDMYWLILSLNTWLECL